MAGRVHPPPATAAGRGDPIHHPPPDRRAVVLLLVVSVVTFAIFFLVPRLAGATAGDAGLPLRRKDAPTPRRSTPWRRSSASPTRCRCSTGASSRASSSGTDYSTGPTTVHCPAPCFGYSFISQNPVWPDLLDRMPVTLSLAVGAAVIWLVAGVATGVLSALRKGSVFDRRDGRRAGRRVAADLLHRPAVAGGLRRTRWTGLRPAAATPPITQDPLTWAYDLILPWITLAFLYAAGYARLTRAGMLETMGEDYIRTARAKGLPERTVVVKHGLRAALTPIVTIFGLDLGLLLGGAVLTETTFSLPRPRQVRRSTPSATSDLPHGAGRDAVRRVLRRDRQPRRGPALRGHRPRVRLVQLTEAEQVDAGADALAAPMPTRPGVPRRPRPARPLPAPTTAWSRRWTGCRSSWSAARRWASSASPAPARA